MEFHEKLQTLRKQKGLTQEQLAESLYISRTAISKWESGRGFPSIESLKAISAFFSVKVDDLLSGEALLGLAEQDRKHTENHFRDLLFGALDCAMALLLFLPFFGQAADGKIQEVSLLALTTIQPWLRCAYLVVVAAMILWGILTFALQNSTRPFWIRHRRELSLVLSGIGAFLFIISRQPYAGAFTFVFLMIKVLMLLKRQ